MADTPTTTTPDSHKARRSGVPGANVTGSILVDMADTTWRMFIPTVGLLMLGRVFDRHLGTKPWLMLLGTMLGAIIAALLIKRQLARGGDK